MTAILGIDFGNSNMRLATPDAAGNATVISSPTGELMIPSVVYFNNDGTIVGTEAYHQFLADRPHGVINWKRHLGQDNVLFQNGRAFRAEDIAHILLSHAVQTFQQKTGQIPTDVAISVPANYDDKKKHLTITAAIRAGLNVICTPFEPTAALLGNGVHKRGNGIYMVIDPGGCTTDVSIGEVSGNSIEIKCTDGEPQLGGQDYSSCLQKMALNRFEEKCGFRLTPEKDPLAYQDLLQRTEQAKITLSVKDQASLMIASGGKIHNAIITRKEYETETAELTERILACAERAKKGANIKNEQILGIFLVGGPSKTPALIQGIENRFGRKPTSQCEPHFATALGCVTAARIEVECQGRSVQVGDITLPPLNLVAREVTATGVGVCVMRDKSEVINCVIVPKGTPIPSDLTKPFKLAEPGQTDALIEILQGPDAAPRDQCLLLGHFELKGMAAVCDDVHRIEIRLRLDKNGMLTATAYDPLSGVKADLVIDYKSPANQSKA